MQLKNTTDIEDFAWGCAFFGTGGGGDPGEGRDLLLQVAKEGLKLGWVAGEGIPAEALTVCPFGMGTIAPLTDETAAAMKAHGLGRPTVEDTLAEAMNVLRRAVGVEPTIVVPLELGGWNTPAALAAAARTGTSVVDGDYAGRAVPEITQAGPALAGEPFWPASAVDNWGNASVIWTAVNNAMAERAGKMLSVASFGGVSMACFTMPYGRAEKMMVHGTLTRCLEVGRAIRAARIQADPVKAVAAAAGAKLIFRGAVVDKTWEDRDGYYWGRYRARSSEGRNEMTVWFKNESHVALLGDRPVVTSPDLIIAVSAAGIPLTNPGIEVGMDIAVLAMPADPLLRSPEGLEVLGPKHFGFDFEPVLV